MAVGVCAGVLSCVAFGNTLVGLAGAVVLPLYFSFYGPEAAVRFSLLLCLHSTILEIIPKVVKSFVPMLHVALFAVLVFLPVNITPWVAVWAYEKLLLVCVPLVSLLEPVIAVLGIMFVSQSLVDEIEERPALVKTVILGISGMAYLLSLAVGYNLLADSNTSNSEAWILFAIFLVSIMLLAICLLKEEGIVSDVAVLSLLMTSLLWAMKQERILSTNPLEAPAQWIESAGDGQSFLSVFLSMATTSLEHLGRAQLIFQNFLSPTRLALGVIRVGSIAVFLWLVQGAQAEELAEEWREDNEQSFRDLNAFRFSLSPLCIRLAVIFVYTEVVIRSVQTTPAVSPARIKASSGSVPDSLDQVFQMFFPATLFNLLAQLRIWRVLQLCVAVLTYVYKLFPAHEDTDEFRW